MGKAKQNASLEPRRQSPRLASRSTGGVAVEPKKKAAAAKKGAKAKKPKPAENGNTKAEEPKVEATEAK